MNISELITRLEKAAAPQRILDAQIAVACQSTTGFVEHLRDEWVSKASPNSGAVRAPYYTSSIDAALTLMPEGDGFMLRHHETADRKMRACCSILGSNGRGDSWDVWGETPAIALCIASLKARQAMGDRTEGSTANALS